MAKKDPTNITVYHTSTNPVPPHTLAARDEKYKNKLGLKPKGGFHAGTINAALDRSLIMHSSREEDFYSDPDNEDHPDGPDFTTYLHTYQINKRPSMVTYEDPHKDGYGDVSYAENGKRSEDYVEDLRVNEHSTKSINKYRNRWEDPGSTSYVIPHQAVQSGYVKHLSTQQFSTDPGAEERDDGGYHAEAKAELGITDK
jgi:hypothetical protein